MGTVSSFLITDQLLLLFAFRQALRVTRPEVYCRLPDALHLGSGATAIIFKEGI